MLIIGNYISPYARKVLLALQIKGIAFELDPIVPYFGNDAFTRLSPLRRIPVLVDGDFVLNDSTVIGEYLDEAYPEQPLFPKTPRERARARWIEEYCDSRMGETIVWKLFFQRAIGPHVWKQPTDEALVAQAVNTELPQIMDWLEAEAPAEHFLFGAAPSMADLTPACFLRNAAIAGWQIDAARWPKSAAWIARVWALPAFAASLPLEKIQLSTPRRDLREALRQAGVQVSALSHEDRAPRRGVLVSGAIASAD